MEPWTILRRRCARSRPTEGMGTDGRGDARILLVCAAVLVIAYLLFATNGPGEDATTFWGYVERMHDGERPYEDFNEMYPPLAWLFILIPGLLGSTPVTYFLVYAGIQTICMWLTLAVVLRTCRHHGIRTDVAAVVYMAMLLCYYLHAIRKFDASAMLFLALSVMLYLDGRKVLAYPVAMIGAMIKVFPALAIALFVVVGLRDRRFKEVCCGILSAVAVAAMVFVPLMLLFSPGDVLWFMEGNVESRGFHLESLLATVSEVVCWLAGMDSGRVYSYTTYDVVNPVTEALSGVWMPVVAIVMLLVMVLVAASPRFRDASDEGRTRYIASTLLLLLTAFLLCNKVFSTSYVMWLLPALTLFAASRDGKDLRTVSAVSAAVFLLSAIEVDNGAWPPLLILRDAALFAILWWSLRYIRGHPWEVVRPSGAVAESEEVAA